MKHFYLSLARTGIRSNSRLYLPYYLACTGMVMLFYILSYLATSPILESMRGGGTLGSILPMGQIVVGIFALLFQIYTNSFLMRRRQTEFGLYSVLGMNKRNLGRLLLVEALILWGATLLSGMALGILLSKLAELCLLRLVHLDVTYAFSVAVPALWQTALVFTGTFFLLYLVNLGRVHLSKPLELLRTEAKGERPPRANWVLAVLGLILLAIAYYEAITTRNPLAALNTFLWAVVLVIAATYLLFISGSVTLCRVLQSKKSYYYQPKHFVSVSSMAYRMKRNGAGLASICILSTMVLVTLTTTVSLYLGASSVLHNRYPRELAVQVHFSDPEEGSPAALRREVQTIEETLGTPMKNTLQMTQFYLSGLIDESGSLDTHDRGFSMDIYQRLRGIVFYPMEDYTRLTGEQPPENGAALICATGDSFPSDTLTVDGKYPLKLRQLSQIPDGLSKVESVMTYHIFVPDYFTYIEQIRQYVLAHSGNRSALGIQMMTYTFQLFFDLDADQTQTLERAREAFGRLNAGLETAKYEVASYHESLLDFLDLVGGLLFLGLLLSVAFAAAAVLIIYYKQLSEGYEDQARFDILQKVGMTEREIRQSVNSQVKTVFFLPLLAAGVHLCFAFPFIYQILVALGLQNLPLLIGGACGIFALFALLYFLVYRRTSRAYFRILT